MKRGMTKVVSMVIAAGFVVSALTGCSNKEPKVNTKQQTAFSGRFEKTVEIKVPVYDRGVQGEPAVDNNYWTKWISEKALKDINVKVTYIPIPRNQDVDKFNMLLAANEAPDIIFSYDYPVISSFMSRGAFQEITQEMLDTYGSNLKKFIGDELMEYGKMNGKQYLIPAKRPMLGDVASTIRKDWLDKLGMKAPTNYDELYEVLKAFKTQDPGGVGRDKVIPWAISGFGNNSLTIPYYGFIPDNISEREFAIYSDLIVTPLAWEPGRKALKFMNKLYNEGLISPEFALDKDGKKAEAAISNGLVGMFGIRIIKSPPVFTTLLKNVPTAEFQAVEPMAEKGNTPKSYTYYPYGMLNGINKQSKNPQAVIAFLDWMSKQENLSAIQNGIEGKTFNLKDGLIIMDSGYKGEERLILNSNKDYYCLVTEQRDTGDAEKNIKIKAIADAPEGLSDYWIENYKASLKAKNHANFLYSKPVISLSKNLNTLKDKFEEAGTKLIMCKPEEFDGLYDKLSKEYLESGYKEIIDEKAKLYDEQKAMK